MPHDDQIVTSPEVARTLGKSVRTVHRLVQDSKLAPLAKLPGPNGAFLFRRDEVERYVSTLVAEDIPA